MKDDSEKEVENLNRRPNNILKFVKSMQKDSKNVEIGQCIRDERGSLDLSSIDKKKRAYEENHK